MNVPTSQADRTWKYRVRGRVSSVLDTLEVVWEEIRRFEPRVPNAVLTLLDVRTRGRLRGYFAKSTWRKRKGAAHEVAISPKLIGHPAECLATILHEAAHAVLFETGDNAGVGSTPYYHTTKFRDQCVKFGLSCNFLNTRYGWVLTSWPHSGVPKCYKSIIDLLRRDLPAGTGGFTHRKVKGRNLPRPGHTILACGCADGARTVYVKKSVLESGGIVCSFCGQEFRPKRGKESA